jgi:hypothetical protein
MEARKILFVSLAVVALALAVALPALAEEPIAMWIQRNRIAWTGRSSGGPDEVVAKIHIFDETRSMVAGASVAAVWTHVDSDNKITVIEPDPVDTAFQGIAEFGIWLGRGDYQICVTDVVKEGWLYAPELNFDLKCSSIDV